MPDDDAPVNVRSAIADLAADLHADAFGCDDDVCRSPNEVSCIELAEVAYAEEPDPLPATFTLPMHGDWPSSLEMRGAIQDYADRHGIRHEEAALRLQVAMDRGEIRITRPVQRCDQAPNGYECTRRRRHKNDHTLWPAGWYAGMTREVPADA